MSSLLADILGSAYKSQEGPTPKRVTAVAWARVSTDMQEERGLSIPEQLRQIREYAQKHDIEIADEYHEAASAFKRESQRVEFHRMLQRARSDKSVSAILVHDYSRFSRDSLKARMLIRELKQEGVRVISLNDIEVDPESVAGVYMEAITFAKNEAYSREVAFHTKKGCRANVQTRDPETGWCYKNGGQPLWGYRSERLVRGEHKAKPIIKSIWVPDDRIVAGRPVYEWTRECLRMAAEGATLDQLRDFCNERGIPAPRQRYWGSTTWHSLLHPNCLLQYAGYGVWNVRGKKQRMNPPSEWVIVDNAHEALIGEEDIKAILAARERRAGQGPSVTGARARSKDSRFILSGGLFSCSRCGANLTGFVSLSGKGRRGDYYVCGSAQYRRSLGCGPAVFVDKRVIEEAVIDGVADRFSEWTDIDSFTDKVNTALRELRDNRASADVTLRREREQIDGKICNLRQALENGLDDVAWANERLRELASRREELDRMISDTPVPADLPRLDLTAVQSYLKRFRNLIDTGTNREKRELVRCFVDSITLNPCDSSPDKSNEPAAHEITINFKAMPAQFVTGMGAGGGFEPPAFGL